MKHKWIVAIAVVVIVGLARSALFVDETELVIVTQFGRPVRTVRDSGLHFKWPHQSAIRLSRQLQIYDPRPSEFLTQEKKNVNLDVFVVWRVDAEDPERFLATVNDFMGAEARLHDSVWSELAAEVGRRPIEALVSTDAAKHHLDDLMRLVASRSAAAARSEYGIEIVDVRLKRVNLPAQVRDSVFQRMRAERSRIARQYRAEGEEEALKIRATADRDRTVILAQAYAEAERKRGEAEAEATRIYAAAHGKDPKLYELLRTLEAYRKFLGEKTTVLLSADSELLKFLRGSGPVEEETGRN